MSRLFGYSAGTLAIRIIRAAVKVLLSYIAWFLIPSLLLGLAPGLLPIDIGVISSFAAAIITLSAMGEMLHGRALGHMMTAGAALTSATYLVIITGLGNLQLALPLPELGSLNVALNFTSLAYLLLLPPLLSMVTNVWAVIVRSSEQEVISETVVETV